MAQRTVPKPTAWVGWIFFAASMLIAVGGMQIIAGLVSIFNRHYFAATRIGLVAFNYTAWGWVHLLLGIVAVLTGVGLLLGWPWTRVVAVFATVLGMIDNVAFLNAYPLWSLVSLVVGGFVLYALTMHGNELIN
jgi:hypothetical protein